MLKILVGDEAFNNDTQKFVLINTIELEFEYSLVSLSKWESKFQRPFFTDGPKTEEEIMAFLKAMLLTPNVGPDVLYRLSQKNIKEIQDYINSKESATTFGRLPERRGPGEVITSELIYYWMVAFTIPLECENWHLNRLFNLIQIANIKNNPNQKKMGANELAQRNRELNAKRKAELGTRG